MATNLFLRGAPRAFHSCLSANGKLFVSGGMQNHKGKWGTGADIWSTEGKLNGWTKYVELIYSIIKVVIILKIFEFVLIMFESI